MHRSHHRPPLRLYTACLLAFSILGAGCATDPDDITGTYVSASKYRDYDCAMLEDEMDHIQRRVNQLHGSLDKKHDGDVWQLGVGIFVWPTLFALEGGDGPEATEYAMLKGEYEAIRSSWVTQQCKRGAGQASTNKPSGIDRMCLAMDQGKNDLTLPESSECPTGYYDTLSGTAR
jgi:hypothetical protein